MAVVAGGADSPWMGAAAVAIIIAGAGITGAQSLRQRRKIEREFRHEPEPRPAKALESDREIAMKVDELLRERAIPWIKTEDFVGPWRDDRVAPFRELVRLLDNRGSIADLASDASLENLAQATRLFLTAYEADAVTDPLLREGVWHMVREEADAAEFARQAARVVNAYLQVQTESRRLFP